MSYEENEKKKKILRVKSDIVKSVEYTSRRKAHNNVVRIYVIISRAAVVVFSSFRFL